MTGKEKCAKWGASLSPSDEGFDVTASRLSLDEATCGSSRKGSRMVHNNNEKIKSSLVAIISVSWAWISVEVIWFLEADGRILWNSVFSWLEKVFFSFFCCIFAAQESTERHGMCCHWRRRKGTVVLPIYYFLFAASFSSNECTTTECNSTWRAQVYAVTACLVMNCELNIVYACMSAVKIECEREESGHLKHLSLSLSTGNRREKKKDRQNCKLAGHWPEFDPEETRSRKNRRQEEAKKRGKQRGKGRRRGRKSAKKKGIALTQQGEDGKNGKALFFCIRVYKVYKEEAELTRYPKGE